LNSGGCNKKKIIDQYETSKKLPTPSQKMSNYAKKWKEREEKKKRKIPSPMDERNLLKSRNQKEI